MKTYSSLKVERTIIVGFLSLIMTGTLLIWAANYWGGKQLSLIDSLFTSTSAVCVTGLVVVDTGHGLMPLSQVILLFLIQLGGLGVMTAATSLLLILRQRIGIRQRLFFAGGMGIDSPAGAVRLLIRILKITLIIEFLGVIPLFWGFYRELDIGTSFFYALFHSVSAFCNAGFSPIASSLEAYSHDVIIPVTIMLLIVTGGLGYLPLVNIMGFIRKREKLHVHTRLVLLTTFLLILGGTVLISATEWGKGLDSMNGWWKIWNSLFQSVTPRTAGFNTVNLSGFSPMGVFILCLLMIIGASPGSTGGGVKTTTSAVLFLSACNFMKGRKDTVIWNRTIHNENILRSLSIVILYLVTIFMASLLISLTEPFSFREIIFEVISALGTVGLSMGITPLLSNSSKIVLIFLMFWGRVGVLTFIYGMMSRDTGNCISYARANIPIG